MTVCFFCHECLNIYGVKTQPSFIHLREDNLYDFVCSEGHPNHFYLQNLKFELLFDSGAMALLDGYPNASVAYLASSLERFYEFCIRVYMLNHNIATDDFEETWKRLSNNSGRQFGAFLCLYHIQNGHTMDLNVNNSLRNKVIHNGYIPSEEEVINYGDRTLQHIRSLLFELKENCSTSITKVVQQHIEQLSQKAEKNKVLRGSLIPTRLSVGHPLNEMPDTFKGVLDSLRSFKLYGGKTHSNI